MNKLIALGTFLSLIIACQNSAGDVKAQSSTISTSEVIDMVEEVTEISDKIIEEKEKWFDEFEGVLVYNFYDEEQDKVNQEDVIIYLDKDKNERFVFNQDTDFMEFKGQEYKLFVEYGQKDIAENFGI